jgi:hypothetical protein
MSIKTESRDKILIEYSLNGNNVSVAKTFNCGVGKNYIFYFDTDNNEYKITKHSYYKKIGPAMKQFNEAVKALKEGINIK